MRSTHGDFGLISLDLVARFVADELGLAPGYVSASMDDVGSVVVYVHAALDASEEVTRVHRELEDRRPDHYFQIVCL